MLLMCVSTACSVGDGEAVGDGAVGAASGHQGEDVMLAGGECAEGTGMAARVQQAGDHLGVQGGAAGRDPRDRVSELREVGDPVLGQVADPARARGEQVGGVLTGLLAPFRARVTVVRRQARPVPGAERVVTTAALHDALPDALVVFVVLALTPQTTGIIGAPELVRMDPGAWLVNVARGRHVDTDALTTAL